MEDLNAIIRDVGPCVVAVSGGIDSMVLAHIAYSWHGREIIMAHAVSPAVPAEATRRVAAHAESHGWTVQWVDVGEFSDAEYLANPPNRCFYCKSNLYGTLSTRFGLPVLSGTNTDDLADFRPGLDAAARFKVRHPYVEAGLGKAAIRSIAAQWALDDLAELPASPCLSSRVESWIPIEPSALAMIDDVENSLRAAFPNRTIRCRLRSSGIVVEADSDIIGALQECLGRIDEIVRYHGFPHPISFAQYRRGSAFLSQAE